MLPEVGHFALILALCFAFLQIIFGFVGAYKDHDLWMKSTRSLALGQSFFIALSFLLLTHAFYNDDFSVLYVVLHSNSFLPTIYKIAAVWGAHEGSLLLWLFILSIWVSFVSVYSRSLPLNLVSIMLGILGIISLGFLLFLLLTSNPFIRVLPHAPVEGHDLNPLLQDFGLVIHPPILYMGYVGFSIPFAFAISVLLIGKIAKDWLQWVRIWTLCALCFLTLGIGLGSWWAYYELGWGGWWFWDPVENASFMPWLVGIAFVHALLMAEKRGIFYGWTLILAVVVFSLSLLGTFLVRSGVITTVHAFASDPARGIFMLQFLLLIVGGSLLVYGFRMKKLRPVNTQFSSSSKNFLDSEKFVERSSNSVSLYVYSRETSILLSTVFLMVSALTILLGTIFPLFYEALTQQKISVGFPYFNAVFIPLMIPFLFLVPIGPMSRWGNNTIKNLIFEFRWVFIISLILSVLLFILLQIFSAITFLGIFLSFWIFIGTLKFLQNKISNQGGIFKVKMGGWAMILAHIGVGIIIIGVTLVSLLQIEKEVKLHPGDSITLANYEIEFDKTEMIEGSNYMSYRGHFMVYKNNKLITHLFPEKRLFLVQNIIMTETAIDPGFFRDIYIALGELTNGAWSARIYYKPFVRWIWLGAIFIALGSLLGAISKIRKRKQE